MKVRTHESASQPYCFISIMAGTQVIVTTMWKIIIIIIVFNIRATSLVLVGKE